jgi:hypothetical protein
MRVTDIHTGEILVARDATDSSVELRIESNGAEETRIVRLRPDEARRLAALILFQSARLERPRWTWIRPHAYQALTSA